MTPNNVVDLKLFKNLPPALKSILKSTLRCINKKPQGRRWQLEEKIQALTLFKNSPRNYNLLSKTSFFQPARWSVSLGIIKENPLLFEMPLAQSFRFFRHPL